jgi:hypothetical protein
MKSLGAASVALFCLILTGCADGTGGIDAEGHNGYDLMTCQDSKAFALDVQHDAVAPDESQERIQHITKEKKKASDQAVRQASDALLGAYLAGDRTAVDAAVVELVKACQL